MFIDNKKKSNEKEIPRLNFMDWVMILAACTSSSSQQGLDGQGSSRQGWNMQEENKTPIGSYVTILGKYLYQLREYYYTFRDDTGEICIEFSDEICKNR